MPTSQSSTKRKRYTAAGYTVEECGDGPEGWVADICTADGSTIEERTQRARMIADALNAAEENRDRPWTDNGPSVEEAGGRWILVWLRKLGNPISGLKRLADPILIPTCWDAISDGWRTHDGLFLQKPLSFHPFGWRPMPKAQPAAAPEAPPAHHAESRDGTGRPSAFAPTKTLPYPPRVTSYVVVEEIPYEHSNIHLVTYDIGAAQDYLVAKLTGPRGGWPASGEDLSNWHVQGWSGGEHLLDYEITLESGRARIATRRPPCTPRRRSPACLRAPAANRAERSAASTEAAR